MISPNLRLPLLQVQVCCMHVHPSAWAGHMPVRFRIPSVAIKPEPDTASQAQSPAGQDSTVPGLQPSEARLPIVWD